MNPRCVSVSTNRRCSAKSSPRPRNVRCELAVVFKPASHRHRAGGVSDPRWLTSTTPPQPVSVEGGYPEQRNGREEPCGGFRDKRKNQFGTIGFASRHRESVAAMPTEWPDRADDQTARRGSWQDQRSRSSPIELYPFVSVERWAHLWAFPTRSWLPLCRRERP